MVRTGSQKLEQHSIVYHYSSIKRIVHLSEIDPNEGWLCMVQPWSNPNSFAKLAMSQPCLCSKIIRDRLKIIQSILWDWLWGPGTLMVFHFRVSTISSGTHCRQDSPDGSNKNGAKSWMFAHFSPRLRTVSPPKKNVPPARRQRKTQWCRVQLWRHHSKWVPRRGPNPHETLVTDGRKCLIMFNLFGGRRFHIGQ
jgi:hypothetical protein